MADVSHLGPIGEPLSLKCTRTRSHDSRFSSRSAIRPANVLSADDEENPGSVVALNNRALLLSWRDQQHREAERLVRRAIEIAGPLAGLLDTRDTIRLNAGQAEQAAKDFEAALIQSNAPKTRFRLALAQLRLGNRAAAEAGLRHAEQEGFDPADLEAPERDAYRVLTNALSVAVQ